MSLLIPAAPNRGGLKQRGVCSSADKGKILKVNPIETVNLILMEVPCCQKIKLFMDPIIHSVGRPIEVRETIISRDGQILKIRNKIKK